MGNPAGVRRDFEALEKRRLEAVRLLGKGLNQSETARRVKVVRQTVARWAKEFRAGGKVAMKKAGRAGRKPRLSMEDKRIRKTKLSITHNFGPPGSPDGYRSAGSCRAK